MMPLGRTGLPPTAHIKLLVFDLTHGTPAELGAESAAERLIDRLAASAPTAVMVIAHNSSNLWSMKQLINGGILS